MRQISLLIKAAMEGMMVCLEHCRRLIDHLATALCECVCVSVCLSVSVRVCASQLVL